MSSSVSEALLFLALVINGGLAGAIYALIALAFVLVYKASRMINFTLGEWIMFGALLASTGSHAIGLGPGAAVLFGCAGMALLGHQSRLLDVQHRGCGDRELAFYDDRGFNALRFPISWERLQHDGIRPPKKAAAGFAPYPYRPLTEATRIGSGGSFASFPI